MYSDITSFVMRKRVYHVARCNIVSFLVKLAPLPTFYKKKSTEGFQSIPYSVALFSAMPGIYYAFLKADTALLIKINSICCFIETIYLCFYLFYAPKQARLLLKGKTCASIVGWICLVFSICVFVAPLAIVRQVIRTKSIEYMPFLLSFFLTLSAAMWFFYGFLIKDFNIAIPNILGFSFGILQMVLYLMYKNSKKVVEQMLPAIHNQIIVPEEQKLPELQEQIIDVVNLSANAYSEIVQVNSPQFINENGHGKDVDDKPTVVDKITEALN
ncbi:hypothetical protein ACH5RR_037735 [Cinchona calisaya]|uniref:Bidirectional sugar transporter SWEET n=1 Tax=Cinchona calisaya TaxID=153742 RepID=A0ABD2Y724_9GENT